MSTQKDWIKNTNIYEVNLRQYTQEGTFNAFSKHLPRLVDMGVKTLWFMPITPISEKNRKGTLGSYYACSDYISINPEFGTLNDFKKLVQEAQSLGLKIIIDWVANHTGWDHKWTTEHPEWYKKDESTGDFKRASGMDDIIELDFANAQMREAMIASMEYWVTECGIDGFRCDLAFWVELGFWQQAIPEVNKIKPLFWLAESDPFEHPEYMEVFDAAYSWIWMHRTEDFYKKQLPLQDLLTILDNYQKVPGIRAWFTSNHDENSWNGSEYEKYGNMAKVLAVFSCTYQGIPLIYSGQELPNLKRLHFFEKGPIEWDGNYGLHYFYRVLLGLQTSNPSLATDVPVNKIKTSADDHIIVFSRIAKEKQVIVVGNFSDKEIHLELQENISGSFRNIFTGEIVDFLSNKNLEITAWGYYVFER